MRFTLPKLFLAVMVAAVACAGLFSPTYCWTAAIVSITISLFAITAIHAIGLRGPERVFAITFALAGTAYLLLVGQPTTLAALLAAATTANGGLDLNSLVGQLFVAVLPGSGLNVQA